MNWSDVKMENVNLDNLKKREIVLSFIALLIGTWSICNGREKKDTDDNEKFGIDDLIGKSFLDIYEIFKSGGDKVFLKDHPEYVKLLLSHFNLVETSEIKIKLENIRLQNFSASEEDLKDAITPGTNLLKAYDEEYKCNYWVFDGSDVGEFSGANVDSICNVIEVDGRIIDDKLGITKQNLEADMSKRFIDRKHETDKEKTNDQSVEKVIYCGYSKGANKAQQCYLYDAARSKNLEGHEFSAEKFIKKHECIFINGMSLSNGTKDFFKDLLKEDFDKLVNQDSKNILNINNENDFISPMNKNPYGKVIYCASKGVSHGHSLQDIDLEEFIKSGKIGKLGWKHRFYVFCYDLLDKYIASGKEIAYRRIKALFMWAEKKCFNCEKNVKGEPIEIQ